MVKNFTNLDPPVGYKALSITPKRIFSPVFMTEWTGRFLTAHCGRIEPHPAPDENCQCGVHASYHPQLYVSPTTAWPLIVKVVGTGKVILHEHGFRAQRAEIIAVVDLFEGLEFWIGKTMARIKLKLPMETWTPPER